MRAMTKESLVSFTQMKDGSKADYLMLHELEKPYLEGTADRLLRELASQANETLSGYRVTRLEHSQINRHVRLRPGMWLDVGMLGAEKPLGTISRQILDDVHMLAAPVVPPPGITFGILVGEHTTNRLHHFTARVVLTSNHLQTVLLPVAFGLDCIPNVRIACLQ
jgi:hypothetical protein